MVDKECSVPIYSKNKEKPKKDCHTWHLVTPSICSKCTVCTLNNEVGVIYFVTDYLTTVVANKTWVSASDHLADKSKLTTYTMFHPAHFVYCLCIVIANFLYNCEACIQSKFCLLPWGKEFQNCLHAFLRLPPFNQDLQPKYKYQLYLIFSKQFISGTHPALLLVCLMQLLLSPAPQ